MTRFQIALEHQIGIRYVYFIKTEVLSEELTRSDNQGSCVSPIASTFGDSNGAGEILVRAA